MNKLVLAISILILTVFLFPASVFAREGICGYEGGISSGEVSGKTTYDYKEVNFITGKPLVFSGTLMIKKQQKQSKSTTTAASGTTTTSPATITTSTYTYTLKNGDDTLTRVMILETTSSVAENGQTTETVKFSKTPTEKATIGGKTYTLKTSNGSVAYDFARSNLIDPKPAVNYHAGSLWSKKVYQVGAATSNDTVTVECTGKFYGYDQYWGNAESLLMDYTIQGDITSKKDYWGGTASVAISATSTEQLEYQKNMPDQISFSGSFVQSRMNSSVLEYTCKLNEFDTKGIATDNMITYKDTLKLETFPTQRRLPTVDASSFAGHIAESDIRLMFGLEVFKGASANFKPDQYLNRAEFAAAMVQIARAVPADPALTSRTTGTTRTTKKTAVISPFNDVSIDNSYFNQIRSSYDRGLLGGKGNNLFGPNDTVSKSDAMIAIVRALGFESLAPSPVAVTGFRDNDLIPAHARNAAYVAKKIGLLQADSKGNMNPSKKLTKAEGAVLFKNLIAYLQDGIKKDYKERIVNY